MIKKLFLRDYYTFVISFYVIQDLLPVDAIFSYSDKHIFQSNPIFLLFYYYIMQNNRKWKTPQICNLIKTIDS